MKFNRILAALVFVGLAACSKKEKDPAPVFPGIPDDITFDKGGLAPISDSEYQEAMKTWQDLSSAPSIDSQLFTKDESDESRTEREKQYAEMSDAWRASIDSIRANCTIDEQNNDGPELEDPKVGDSFTTSESGNTSGSICSTTTSINGNSLTTLLAKDAVFNMEFGTQASFALDSQIQNPADVTALGYSSMRFSGKLEARAKASMGGISEMFTHADGQGETVLANGQKITYTLTVDGLKKSGGLRVTVIHVMFAREGGTTVTYSHHIRYQNGFKVGEEKYFGNRQLSASEVDSLGKFPLPLEELAAID